MRDYKYIDNITAHKNGPVISVSIIVVVVGVILIGGQLLYCK